MAAALTVSVIAELTGLGEGLVFVDKGINGTTPTAFTKIYKTLAKADTAEALDLGDVSTIACIVIRAITKNLDIDLDYADPFSKDLTIKAGEEPAVIPNPAGIVYVKNNTESETPVFEYIVIGTT